MEFDFVSLVAAGDDPEAQVVIAKAEPDEKCGAHEDPAPTLTSTDRKSEGTMGNINKSDLDPEVVAYIEGLEDEVSSLNEQVEKSASDIETAKAEIEDLKGTLAKSAPKDAESAEEITKSLLAKADPAVRALIEKQQADLAAATEIAKAEREARLSREYIAKAEDLPMLSADSEEGDGKAALAGLLRAAADRLLPEDNERLNKVLKAANAQIAKSGLFAEFGRAGAQTTISKSVEGKAQELMKADPSLTFEQAQVKVMESDPSLAAALLNGEEN